MDIMLTEDFIKLAKKYDSIKHETLSLMEDAGNKLKKSLEEGIGNDTLNKWGAGLWGALTNPGSPLTGAKDGARNREAYDAAKNVINTIKKGNEQARQDINDLNRSLDSRKKELEAIGSKLAHSLEKTDSDASKRIADMIKKDSADIKKFQDSLKVVYWKTLAPPDKVDKDSFYKKPQQKTNQAAPTKQGALAKGVSKALTSLGKTNPPAGVAGITPPTAPATQTPKAKPKVTNKKPQAPKVTPKQPQAAPVAPVAPKQPNPAPAPQVAPTQPQATTAPQATPTQTPPAPKGNKKGTKKKLPETKKQILENSKLMLVSVNKLLKDHK
jgi:hypothetical protein